MRLTEFWQRVAAERAKLPEGAVHITSLNNHDIGTTAGVVVAVTRDMAAQRIVQNTHRLATPDEVQALKDQEEVSSQHFARLEALRRPSVTILPDAFAELVRGGERQQKPAKG